MIIPKPGPVHPRLAIEWNTFVPLRLIIHIEFMKLNNKIAIITGGASGIGLATVQRFIREGAYVAIWDINAEKGNALAATINAEWGGKAIFQQVNTTKLADCITAATEVHAKWGGIDILINNAGITKDATLKNMTPETWQQVIDVNLSGVFHCTKAVSTYMLERKYGRIITASSIVGLFGNFGQTNYAATKSGVIGMTKVWARELGRKGITVNAIAPGFIGTEMMHAIPEEVLQGFKDRTPVGRLGTPDEVASLYCFLASDEAAYINGTVISIDGGLTL